MDEGNPNNSGVARTGGRKGGRQPEGTNNVYCRSLRASTALKLGNDFYRFFAYINKIYRMHARPRRQEGRRKVGIATMTPGPTQKMLRSFNPQVHTHTHTCKNVGRKGLDSTHNHQTQSHTNMTRQHDTARHTHKTRTLSETPHDKIQAYIFE